MKIGVLANSSSWYWREIERAAAARGHACERFEFEMLHAACGLEWDRLPACRMDLEKRQAGSLSHEKPAASSGIAQGEHDLSDCDVVVVRTMPPGSLEQVVFRMDALQRLHLAGTRVINSPKAIECATDKYLTTARLEMAGLPVPRTIVCQETESAMAAFQRLGGDVVIKPIFGAEGRGICRVSDPDLAFRTFRTLERTGAVIYCQEFIRHAGFDVRVLVLNGKVIGGMKRYGANGDFRTNVSRDGRPEAHQPTDEEIQLALRATEVVGATFAGIDLLYDPAGRCFVIEVNAVPGWQGFNRANGVDVAELFVAALEAV